MDRNEQFMCWDDKAAKNKWFMNDQFYGGPVLKSDNANRHPLTIPPMEDSPNAQIGFIVMLVGIE